jgi:hypothetical protein
MPHRRSQPGPMARKGAAAQHRRMNDTKQHEVLWGLITDTLCFVSKSTPDPGLSLIRPRTRVPVEVCQSGSGAGR